MLCRGSISEYLGQLPLFQDLSAEQLGLVSQAAVADELFDGEWLFRQGDPARHVYVIGEGQVALLRQSLDGRESILALVGNDETLGEELLTLDQVSRDVSARAVGDCALVRIDREVFRRAVEQSADLARVLLQTVHRRQRMLIDHIERLSFQDAGGRVVNYLLSLIGEAVGAQRIRLPVPKRDLAAHLAIQPETLSRVLSRLKRNGFLREEKGWLVVDADQLRSHLHCEDCEQNCWGCPKVDVALVQPALLS